MPLLMEYTVSLLDNEKIVIDFVDSTSSDYELHELLSFFRKYKKETYIEHKEISIFFIVTSWRYWLEFLIELGFRDTAQAISEILNDLEIDRTPTMEEYIEQLKHAKIIKDFKKEKTIDKDEERYEQLKQVEVDKVIAEKKLFTILEKTVSECAFERELPRLLQKYYGQWVAYLDGDFICAEEDKDLLLLTINERGIKPDLIKKIEEKIKNETKS